MTLDHKQNNREYAYRKYEQFRDIMKRFEEIIIEFFVSKYSEFFQHI